MTLKNKNSFYFFLAITVIIYLLFGTIHLVKFETSDERYWMYEDPVDGRIHAYWDAVSKGQWESTRINDKPGITLALVCGPALLFKNNPADGLFLTDIITRTYEPQEMEKIHLFFRFPLLIFNGLFCLFLFWLILKLTGNHWIALWSAIFILLSPIILGISQIVNPDSLLWAFSSGAVFSFLNYLKHKEKKFAVLSSIMLGFSLLTKYSAVILIPFFLAALLIHLLSERDQENKIIHREIINLVLSYAAIIIGSIAVFSFFMPAVFAYPPYLYEPFVALDGFGYIFIAIICTALFLFLDALILRSRVMLLIIKRSGRTLPKIFLKLSALLILIIILAALFIWMADTYYGEEIMKDVAFDTELGHAFKAQDPDAKVILEFVPLVFSLTPLTLAAFVFLLATSSVMKVSRSTTILSMLAFVTAFYLAVLLQNLLVTIRYSIMLYPAVLFLSALGLWEFFSWKKLEHIKKSWITVGLLLISVFSLFMSMPFYFNYTSMLLPNERIITDSWGYGGYEAARYINSQENSNNFIIWTDYNGVCPFIKGRCIMGKNNRKFKPENADVIPDYFVKTRRGSNMYSDLWRTINDNYLYETQSPEWEMAINGRTKNFIKVYKNETARRE